MRKIGKGYSLGLIFILILAFWVKGYAWSAEPCNLRVPMEVSEGRFNEGEFFVTDATRVMTLREAIYHEIGHFFLFLNPHLYIKSPSRKVNGIRVRLNSYADKIDKMLADSSNLNWEIDFIKVLKSCMNYFNEGRLTVLCNETKEEYINNVKYSREWLNLFYKSFTGNDEVKNIDTEKLFNIIWIKEHNPYITFNFKSQEKARYVRGKQGELHRAFLYLARNSIEALEEKRGKMQDKKDRIALRKFKGRIDINAYIDNGYSVTEISDNGIGMPTKALEAFKNRKRYSTKYKDWGGRGWIAARNIIERNNGTIDVRSKLGEGTTVTVILPVSQKIASNDQSILVSGERIKFSNGDIDMENLGEPQVIFSVFNKRIHNLYSNLRSLNLKVRYFLKKRIKEVLQEIVLNSTWKSVSPLLDVKVIFYPKAKNSFKREGVLKIMIKQVSCGHSNWRMLNKNHSRFEEEGLKYLVDRHRRAKDSAVEHGGTGLQFIAELKTLWVLVYTRSPDHPYPLLTELYIELPPTIPTIIKHGLFSIRHRL